jgi:hypothetical protein
MSSDEFLTISPPKITEKRKRRRKGPRLTIKKKKRVAKPPIVPVDPEDSQSKVSY